jgi:hypothetical protein
MAKRKAGARDFRDIRRMVKAAGGRRAFNAWVDRALSQPPPRRGGRKKGAVTYNDALMFQHLATVCEVLRREKGMTQFAAIKWWVKSILQEAERLRKPGEPPFLYFGTYGPEADGGIDADSIARRLDAKLKQGKIPRAEIPAASRPTLKPLV